LKGPVMGNKGGFEMSGGKFEIRDGTLETVKSKDA
jgi:hypothetical protein